MSTTSATTTTARASRSSSRGARSVRASTRAMRRARGVADDADDVVVEEDPMSAYEREMEATRARGRAIALSGFATGAFAFAFTASVGTTGSEAVAAGANLAKLEASSTPLDRALVNGKPTVVEFYADWCEVCKESAPTVYAVEREHANGVNFVMLNIDNVKWSEEMDTYGVDGIPHLEFLDARGESEGFIVGKFPREVLEKNVSALEAGEKTLPYAKQYGKASAAEPGVVPSADPRAPVSQATSADPRAHG
jgi:thiol-disulfide isomerase/thioredoxin